MPQTQFVPVDPNQLVGPYPQQSVVPQPSTPPSQVGGGSKAGGIAKIFTEFVGGAAQGRIRKFSMEQNEKLKNIAILGQYIQSVESDPNLTDEAKAYARQKYFESLGMETLQAFGGEKGKGKKGKGGDQPQGVMGHLGNILKEAATGMVGGQMPKGAPNVNPQEIIGNIYSTISQPQYSIKAVSGQYASQVNEILKKYPPGTPPETVNADPELRAKFNEWSRVDPQGAQSFSQMAAQAYPSAPSTAAEMQTLAGIGKPAAGGGTPPPGPPATAQPGAKPQGIGFTGVTLTGDQRQAAERMKRIRPGEDWEIDGTRIRGSIIDLSDRAAFFDQNNREVSVDIGKLIPYQGFVLRNIVNPNDPTDARSVRVNKDTGIVYDTDGIPVPPDMQKWQKGTGFYRGYQDRKAFVNAQGQQVYQKASGEFYTAPGTVRQTPDRWLQHFNITEQIRDARDARNAQVRAESQYNIEKNRIKRTWAQKVASIDRDLPLLKAKEKEAKKKEYQDLQAKELQELEQDHNDMVESLGGMYGQGAPPPKQGGEEAPATPKKPPKSNVAPGAQAVLPD